MNWIQPVKKFGEGVTGMLMFSALRNAIQKYLNATDRYFIARPRLILIVINNLAILITGMVFYPLMFSLMNYPLKMDEVVFFHKWIGIPYELYYGLIILFAIVVNSIFLLIILKDIHRWGYLIGGRNPIEDQTKLMKDIKNQCVNLPYLIYAGQIVIPALSVLVINILMFIINSRSYNDYLVFVTLVKLILVIFFVSTLYAIILFLFSKRLFRIMLVNAFEVEEKIGIRISLKNKIILQILPIFVVTILFICLSSYSRIIEEKGLLLFNIYKHQLKNVEKTFGTSINAQKVSHKLLPLNYQSSKDCHFVIDPRGGVTTSNNAKLSSWFLNYIKDLSVKYDGQVKDSTGEVQGAATQVERNGETWIIGIKYNVYSPNIIMFFMGAFLGLVLIHFILITCTSKSIAEEISLVTYGLTKIARGKKP